MKLTKMIAAALTSTVLAASVAPVEAGVLDSIGEHYQAAISADVLAGNTSVYMPFMGIEAVPAGKRLLIENVSYSTWLRSTQTASCTLRQGSKNLAHLPSPTPGPIASLHRESSASVPTKVFVEAGNFNLSCWRSATDANGKISVVITGRLVDAQ